MAKKEINLVLDTMEKPNRPIGTFKQLDDIVINLQIVENSKAKDLTSQRVRLYICKPDKNVVGQISGIEVVSAKEGKIKINLMNAATQVSGIAVGELNIRDEGGSISTLNFYYNVVPKIMTDEVIESTNVIEVVEELEKTLAKAKKDLAQFNEFQVETKRNEEARKLKETERISTENTRIGNEKTRVSAENERVSNENKRKQAESERASSESSRISSESIRINAESQRNADESVRTENEQNRVSKEAERVNQEKSRVQNEEKRVELEKARVEAETKRNVEFTKWTDAKFLVDDSKVTDSKTWSSKKIVDYVQSNDTTWTPKTIEGGGKIDSTNKGYVKRLEIEGQTLKNVLGIDFKNLSKFDTPHRNVSVTDGYLKVIANGDYVDFNSKKIKGLKNSTLYTLIIEIKECDVVGEGVVTFGSGRFESHQFLGDIDINISEFKTKKIIKKAITSKGNVNSCTGGLRSFVGPEFKSGHITFRYYMLEGDYTQKEVPDFIENVQSVGLKTEEGYKIGVKTYGKNLFNKNGKFETLMNDTDETDYNLTYDSVNDLLVSEGTSGVNYNKGPYLKLKPKTKYTISFNCVGLTQRVGLQNGEQEEDATVNSGESGSVTTTTTQTGRLWLYILKTGEPMGIYGIKDLQLEEGSRATEYDPYKESIQEITIQQQLNTGDKLVFENGEYVIKTSTGQAVKTNINNEMLPATFDGATYVTQDAGVKGTLKGQFPINSQAAITSLENKNKELEERLGQQEEMLTILYSFYRGTLEETEHIEEDIMTTEEL